MKALTANDLLSGEAVFWSRGRWAERFGDADIFQADAEAGAALAAAEAQPTVVVAAYLIDLQDTPAGPVPVSFRERVRALGPTNHPQHGKQAEGGRDIEALSHATGAARSTGRLELIKRH
jgi:hypothetical protein